MITVDYFINTYSDVIDYYMPNNGEGDTMASQIATAVNKLIYGWYYDDSVFETDLNFDIAWPDEVDDLSDRANWLYSYVPESRRILMRVFACSSVDDYEELLMNLADTLLDEDLLEKYDAIPKQATIYTCKGKFECHWDEDAELQGQGSDIESSFVYPEDMEALENGEYESHVTEPIKSATRTLPDGTEYDPEDYEGGYTEWEMIDTKQVKDSDGFWTDYTMWYNEFTDTYCFTFGDKDIYYPENADWDWECENEDEAWEWFNDYNGFEDEDEYDDSDDLTVL